MIKKINRLNDEEIIDVVVRIMGNGTMVIETVYESILVELLKIRGTPIKTVGGRDSVSDYKRWLEDSKDTNTQEE